MSSVQRLSKADFERIWKKLRNNPGVVGISKKIVVDKDGRRKIRVYVNGHSVVISRDILPPTLEDMDIELVYVGQVEALGIKKKKICVDN